jgi:anti-sigma B factor antagonist
MLDDPLRIVSRPGFSNGCQVFELTGPLVLRNLFEFQTRVREDRSSVLVIELSGVPYIDSAGIGALVGTHVSHQRQGGVVALAGLNDRVKNALEITQVLRILQTFATMHDAERALSTSASQEAAS